MNSNSNRPTGDDSVTATSSSSSSSQKAQRSVEAHVDAWWRRHIAGSAIARHTPIHNALLQELPALVRRLQKAKRTDKAWQAAAQDWRTRRLAGSRIGRHQPCMAALDDALKQLTPKE